MSRRWLGLALPIVLATPCALAAQNGLDEQILVSPSNPVDVVHFDALDVPALLAEDEQRAVQNQPLRIAMPTQTNLPASNFGTMSRLADGRVMWRLRIEAQDAVNLNIGTHYEVPDSAQIYILDKFGDMHFRSLTCADNQDTKEFWTPVIPGDEMNIYAEMNEADWPAFRAGFSVSSVNIGYKDMPGVVFQGAEPPVDARSGSCNVDVVCPEADPWDNQVPAIGRTLLGGSILCSGSLINNTAEDGTPYFITATHCGITTGNASSLVIYWNYQNSTCRTPGSGASGAPGNGSFSQFSSGSTLRCRYTPPGDVTLVQINSALPPAYNLELLGWDRSSTPPTSGVGIHHPSGQEKRFSREDNATIFQSVNIGGIGVVAGIRVSWNLGVTEGGSSGSPFLNQNSRIVGVLSGGSSFCSTPTSPDYYARFDTAWEGGGTSATRLKDWLDPGNTGATTLGQYNAAPPDPPAPFNLTSPANGATEVDSTTNINLLWSSSDPGVTYDVVLSANSDLSSPIIDAPAPSGFFTVPGGTLSGNTTYYWGVTATALGLSTNSTPYPGSFTTASVASNCPGDADGDNAVTLNDLNIVLFNFGTSVPVGTQGDVDEDGNVTLNDLNIVLFNFGTSC
ncbi:MAG: trypsin-like serine protease [Phycisphaerales bacterium]|nr:trypsin-like serine protease [Phycisphaerales bacterium]